MKNELDKLLLKSSTNEDAALRLLAESQVTSLISEFKKIKDNNEKLKKCLSRIVEDIYTAHNMNNKEVNPNWESVNQANILLKEIGDTIND